MNRKWVKLWRKTEDSRVFQNEGLLKVWIWCLIRATHKEVWVSIKTGRGQTEVLLKPGQFLFGREAAAAKLRMKPSTVWLRIRKLRDLGKVNIESNSHFSIITIINWGIYQAPDEKDDIESNSHMTGNEQPYDTFKNNKNNKNKKDSCPHQSVLDIYHEMLPGLPSVKRWTEKRKGMLRARWTSGQKNKEGIPINSLEYWKRFFEYVSGSDFLTGRVDPSPGRKRFRADLEWLLTESNFIKVIEGKYHGD